MLELAKVVEVNARAKTVNLLCVNTHRTPSDVPLGYSSSHPDHAGGDDSLPEVGSYCYVAFPSDASSPFVMCFINKPAFGVDDVPELNYADNKASLEPGDRRISTADGNTLLLRRGGVVELGANALTKMLMIPVENVLRFYAQRYQLRSPLGEIDWGHVTLTADGVVNQTAVKHTPVLVRYDIKSTAQEIVKEHYTVEVRTGLLNGDTLVESAAVHAFAHLHKQQDMQEHSPPDGDGAVSIVIFDHATKRKAVFAFQVSAAGDVYWNTKASIYIAADKVFVTASELKASVSSIIDLTSPSIKLGNNGTYLDSARKTDAVQVTMTEADVTWLVGAMSAIAAAAASGNPPPEMTHGITGTITGGSTVVKVA